MNEYKIVTRRIKIDRIDRKRFGICFADSKPYQWSDVGVGGAFDECLVKCQEFVQKAEDEFYPFPEQIDGFAYVSCENYTTNQIVIAAVSEDDTEFPTARTDDGWYYEQKDEGEILDILESWRSENGAGVTHVVLRKPKSWDEKYHDPRYFFILSLSDSNPEHPGATIEKGGSEAGCRAYIDDLSKRTDDDNDDGLSNIPQFRF